MFISSDLVPCCVLKEKNVRIFKQTIYENNCEKKSVFVHFEMSNEGLAVILAQNY